MTDNENKTLLSSIVSFSLRFRKVVLVLALMGLAYGFYSLSKAKYDVFPDFASAVVQIQTEALGLTAEQVAQLVTQPLENAIVGVQGIKSVKSTSIQGLSVISIFFENSTNVYLNRQMIAERMSVTIPLLPKGLIPIMTPLTSTAEVIATIGIVSDELTLIDLRTIADWVIMPRLLGVPGVASVTILGEGVKQLQVQVGSSDLLKFQVTMQDIVNKTALATGVQGAGFIDTFNQRINIQSLGQTLTAEELGKTVILHNAGQSLALEDVATVVDGQAPPFGAGLIMGKEGIVLQIASQYKANTVEVTQGINVALKELSEVLKKKKVTLYDNLFRSADFIDLALHNLKIALLIGAVLVAVILFLFLLNWKTVLIALIAIPLSLIAAVTVMNFAGYSLNTMTLGGLAIALGLLVDDAVITIENIFRRIRENKTHPKPSSSYQVILDATLEVRGAVVYATFAIIIVFIPILSLKSVAGSLFSPLSMAYIIATLASLVTALTLTPVLCYFIISKEMKEPVTISWSKRQYKKTLENLSKAAPLLMIIVVLFIGTGFASIFFLKRVYLPEINGNYFVMHMNFTPGTALSESLRIGKTLTEKLLKIPEVKLVAQRAGRGKEGTDIHGTYQNELDISVKTSDAVALENKIRELFAEFPGVNFSINSYLAEIIEDTLIGYAAPFVINIYGYNSDELDRAAKQIADGLKSVPGAIDILMLSPPGTPQVTINLRKDDMKLWGVNAVDVLDLIQIASQGKTAGQIFIENQIFDVVVKLKPDELKTPDSLKKLLIRNASQNYITLDQIADVYMVSGSTSVLHEGGRRVQTVTCDISNQDIQTFSNNVKKLLSKIPLSKETTIEISGLAEEEKKTTLDLLFKSLIAGLFVALILYMIVGTLPNVLLLLFNLPFALVGGIIAVFLTGKVLSIGSMIGFITVFGITLRNSIMILLHAHHLVRKEGKEWNQETIFLAAQERLAPILMTALATGFGILAIAVENGKPGTEIEGPLAIVILGGLITSTLLNLLVLPILLNRYSRFFKPNGTNEKPKL